jgi:hypothetical protein
MRVPVNPELGMAARICVPLRFEHRLLGFLWLIDDPPLDDAELKRTLGALDELALALYRATEDQMSSRIEERQILRAALGLDLNAEPDASEQLIAQGLLASGSGIGIIAVQPHRDGDRANDVILAHVAAAVEHERRLVAPGQFLLLVDRIVYALFASTTSSGLHAQAARIAERLASNLPADGWRAAVGVSDVGGAADGLPVRRRHAELAASIARRVPGAGPWVAWDDLGAYRPLALLVDDRDPTNFVTAPLRLLMVDNEASTLVPSLISFLEHGGNARAAAAELFVHRSSLYQRLHRIERVCGIDLSSGDARLELHLALRLWRMAGEPAPGEFAEAAADDGRAALGPA